jgi:hypothetical protein
MRRRFVLLSALALTGCPRTTPQPPPPVVAPPPVHVPDGCLQTFTGRWVDERDPSFTYEAEDDGGTLVLHVSRQFNLDAGFVPRRFSHADAGSPDAGAHPKDGGVPARDAGLHVDAGALDAAAPDAGTLDAGCTDAGADAGPAPGLAPPLDDADAGFAPRVTLRRTADGFSGLVEAELPHPTGRLCRASFVTTVLSCADGGLTLESEGTASLSDTCQPPLRPAPAPKLQHRLVRAQP